MLFAGKYNATEDNIVFILTRKDVPLWYVRASRTKTKEYLIMIVPIITKYSLSKIISKVKKYKVFDTCFW